MFKKAPKTKIPVTILIIAILVFVALGIALPYPLLGTVTLESGLWFAAFLGPAFLLAGAARGAERDSRGFAFDARLMVLVVISAFLFFAIAISINSMRFVSCAHDRGVLALSAVSIPVLFLNSMLGLWFGRLIGRKVIATLASMLFFALYLFAQFSFWWFNPSFRFINHLWVLISGDLIEGQQFDGASVAFRIATLLFGLGLLFFGLIFFRNKDRQGLQAAPSASPSLAAIAVVTLISACYLHFTSLDELMLEHRLLNQKLRTTLGRSPLVLHFDPEAIDHRKAEAMLEEAWFWLKRIEQRTGIEAKKTIHIWLHRTMEDQARFTGAKHVHFALPKHREIHVSNIKIPHPTLGHELAHVLFGQKHDSLLGLPTVWGILPHGALVEGLAVAVTPELNIRDDLTLFEQAAAMRRAGFVVDTETLFRSSTEFWMLTPAQAYVSAGATIEALVDFLVHAGEVKNTQEAFQRIARANHPDEISSRFAEFSKTFENRLATAPLPQDAVPSASLMFTGLPILLATCDPSSAEPIERAKGEALQDRFESAERHLKFNRDAPRVEECLALADWAAQLNRREKELEYLKLATQAKNLQDERRRAEVSDRLAQAYFRTGQIEGAYAHWKNIDLAAMPPAKQRLILAKQILINAQSVVQKPAIAAALELLQDHDDNVSTARYALLGYTQGMAFNHDEQEDPAHVLTKYLFARSLYNGKKYAEALEHLHVLENHFFVLPTLFREEISYLTTMSLLYENNWGMGLSRLIELRNSSHRASQQVMLGDLIERTQSIVEANISNTMAKNERWLLGITDTF